LEALADEGDIIEISVGSFKMHGPKDDAGVPGYWGWVSNYFVFAINDGKGAAVKYLSKLRAAAPVYLEKVSGTGDLLAVYMNCEKIAGIVTAVASQEGATDELSTVSTVIKELGLDNVKTVTARAGFAEADVVCNELISVEGVRRGLLANLGTIKLSMFDMVDAGAVNAAAVNYDVAGIYDTIMRAVKAGVPEVVYALIEQTIAGFEEQAKFNIRTGLLESLAGPMVFYSLPAGVMMEVPSGGVVAMAKLKDASLLEKTMVALGQFVAAKGEGMLQVSSQVQSDGRTYHSWVIAPLAMMQVMPCWTVAEDHVVIASNATLCNVAVKRIASAGSGKKSIRTTEGFKKATAKVPGKLVCLSYTDSKVQFSQMMVAIQQFWPMLTMVAAQGGVKLPVVVPSLADIVKDMGPTCQYAWFDSEGLRSYYEGSGIEVGAVAAVPIGATVLLPALSKARTRAKHAVSASNLHQIALALKMYADDHDGKFPSTLEGAKSYYHDEKLLESPLKPKGFDGPSYVYIAHETPYIKSADKYIVIYENPEYCRDKINVLFLDFSVRTMKREEFLETLKETCEHLGREMPEIKFKGSKRRSFLTKVEIPMPTER
jgi:hypothetical protein